MVVLLAAALIVRDEEANLPACLASLDGVVDAIHVYDTGSVDSTVSVALSFGAHVTRGRWDDDFAAARNTASEGWTAAEAWKKNEEVVKKIFDALKKIGVEDKDLKTSNLNVQPRYLNRPNEQPQFLGYTVSYDLTVTVRKLDRMGAMLDRMVDAGANRNMNISFGCSKLDDLMDQAREKAVAEARKKANLYVTGAGANLGDVLGISDTPWQPQYFPVDAMAVREGKVSLPVAQGTQELNVNISVTWAIENSKS